MRYCRALVIFCSLCAALSVPASALKIEKISRTRPASGGSYQQEVAAGSAIVRFKAGVSTQAAAAALSASGFSLVKYSPRFDYALVSLPANMSVENGITALSSLAQVSAVAPNRVFRASRVPSDPYAVSQYALSRIQAFGGWEYETGFSSRTTIAFIDTGIDASHPELSGKMAGTSRYFNPDTFAASNNQPATPACNHATRGAGVAAASSDNNLGIAGVSWGANVLSLKVFSDSDCNDDCSDHAGYGSCSTTENAIGEAIDEAIPLHNTAVYGKVIINISLGSVGSCSDTGFYPLQTAVNSAVNAGLLIFAAAGNEAIGYIDSPANCAGVKAVGATDASDNLASFSNTDSTMTYKGLTAPGVALYTTDIGGGYASASGTSFASPMAAGLASLVWSAHPSYTAAQVFDVMKNSADDLGAAGPDRDFGWGRINAAKALRLAATGSASAAAARKASAYPNPFRPSSQRLVTFTVPDADLGGNAEVKVYTSEGELVRKLDTMAWDGRNSGGSPVASGVYLFRVKTDKGSATGSFALIR